MDARQPEAVPSAELGAKRELRLLLTAVQFFTRIPVPGWVGWSPEQLNASARHFPSVGLLVGAVSGGVLLGASLIWPPMVAAWLAIAAGLLLTGGFHEDGLADSFDGFGGGQGPEQVLAIMKDSRVGSYATLAVALVLGLKTQLLVTLWQGAPSALWALAGVMASHTLSRWAALAVMARLEYVREDALSKSKPIAQGIGAWPLAFASLVALLPGVVVGWFILPMALAALLVWALAVRYLRMRLGGYVGDALGATQQLAELALLLVLTGLLPWIWSSPLWL